MGDAYGRAIRDWYRGRMVGPLVERDGGRARRHPIESYYFEPFDPESQSGAWLSGWVDGPTVDVGAGAGRLARHVQRDREVVALDASPALVETMAERGVADTREGDMFALPDQFDANRFETAVVIGTQACLAGSRGGLEAFLADLATVTTPAATAVVDGYDPTAEGCEHMLGYRPDPTPGLAHRVAWYEYDGSVDPALYFRLFGPERFRTVAEAAGWRVMDTQRAHEPHYYRVALKKA